MNKDEMIEDMKIVINQSVVRSNSGLDLSRELMALSLDKLGYRKVGEDEIVIKKSEYEDLSKDHSTIDGEAYYCGFSAGIEEGKQTAREILQAINKYLVGTRGIYTVKTFRNCRFEDIMLVRADDLETLVKKLAKGHDIELEE